MFAITLKMKRSPRSLAVGGRLSVAVCVTIAVIALTGPRARAVTLEEVVELSQAGIGEVVLIELIKMDDIAYPLTASRLRALKGAGVSDHVLLALLRSGWSVDGHRTATAQRDNSRRTTRSNGCRGRTRAACEPVVARSVLVPTRPARGVGGRQRAPGPRTAFGFGGVSGFRSVSARPTGTGASTRREPVYWGWGGKKRPGSWNGHSETDR